MLGRFAMVLALWASPGGAQDWVKLTGDEIRTALTDQKFVYPKKDVQTFFASGRTLYETSEPSWGYWEVRGDQYCSQWPPSDLWTCYDMSAADGMLRFTGPYDDVYEATRIDD